VVWIHVSHGLDLGPYFWFGGLPGQPLPAIEDYTVPLRATHNKQGVRPARTNHRLVPKEKFDRLDTIDAVLDKLLGDI